MTDSCTKLFSDSCRGRRSGAQSVHSLTRLRVASFQLTANGTAWSNVLFIYGNWRLGRYSRNAGRTGWEFAWRGCI